MTVDLFESVTECGCAAKVPAQELAGMLCGVEVPTSPAVLVGPDTLDDAGVYQFSHEQCLLSAAAYTNRAYAGDTVQFDDDVTCRARDLLFDPQTSGGLFICCPSSRASELVGWAREELPTACGVVGRVIEAAGKPLIRVRRGAYSPVQGDGETAP